MDDTQLDLLLQELERADAAAAADLADRVAARLEAALGEGPEAGDPS